MPTMSSKLESSGLLKNAVGIIAFCAWIIGFMWMRLDKEGYGFLLFTVGWIATLLVIGYHSTPSNSIYGKSAFGFVVVMVCGILFKILHFAYGDEIIILSLVGISGTYLAMWLKKKPQPKDD
jgi:hypothetical protein